MHVILQDLYEVLDHVESISSRTQSKDAKKKPNDNQDVPDISPQYAKMVEKIKDWSFGGPVVNTKRLFELLFGWVPDQNEQISFIKVMKKLKTEGVITDEVSEVLVMLSGKPGGKKFGDTKIGEKLFEELPVTGVAVDYLTDVIYQTEKALCRLGAEYIIPSAPSEDEQVADFDVGIYDHFWQSVVNLEGHGLTNLLELGKQVLSGVAGYQLRHIKFQYVSQEFYGQIESELERMEVCTGNYDAERLLHALFGKNIYITPAHSYHMTKAVLNTCEAATNHPCWADLLRIEFGTKKTTATSVCTGADTFLDCPSTSLQAKLSQALVEVANRFIELTEKTRQSEPAESA